MATSLSTLTQDSLNEAMDQIRKETAQSIENLRKELQKDVLSMEDNIATAVINALKTPQIILRTTFLHTSGFSSLLVLFERDLLLLPRSEGTRLYVRTIDYHHDEKRPIP
jgi:hypothetical protein